MIQFEQGQFEIAIVTFRRPEYVKAWLNNCYEACSERNIILSVYDSSPDKETEQVIKEFNYGKEIPITYHRIDERTNIGYKPMIPLLETTSEYLWVSGDSRYHDFNELDEKVFPKIKNRSIDYLCINTANNYKLPDAIYYDRGMMLHDIFIASTCIGLSIYRTAIFNPIKENKILLNKYDVLFKNNYGFGWLGYFYNVYALGNYQSMLVNAKVLSVLNKKKTQSWAVRFYGCWAEDLCQIIDNIPDSFIGKELIPKNTWNVMDLDAIPYCYLARKQGDLSKDKYKELKEKGYIERITDNPGRIRLFAEAPMPTIESIYAAYRVASLGISTVNTIVTMLSRRVKK